MKSVSGMRRASGRMIFRAEDLAANAIARLLELPEDAAGRIFTRFDARKIRAAAQRIDEDSDLQAAPLAGLLISIKDVFDEVGEVTTAGSLHFQGAPAAIRDAEVIVRLKAAGAIPFGRTTMSEFAYSGVGLNPHFGTPPNSCDSTRIPGGSSSGGALSVALGIADGALGTDTGGSVRIPAAYNSLAGFKPTQMKIPLNGVFPLSVSYDSIGPMAHDIRTCAAIYEALSGEFRPDQPAPDVRRLRLGIPRTVLSEGLGSQVAADFDLALTALSEAGAQLVDIEMPELIDAGAANRIIVASDAYRLHQDYLITLERTGDPRVLNRIRAAEEFSSGDEPEAREKRRAATAAFRELAEGFDAFLAPTVAIVPPLIEEVEADFDRLNSLILRNPSSTNFLDGCAATVPMHAQGDLPTGLMIFGPSDRDWGVLVIAHLIESLVSRR